MAVECKPQGLSSSLSSSTPILPQIKNESFLEDINNVLNSGDIPNLYTLDEQDQIINTMRPYVQEQGLQPTKANLMAAYTGRVRSNIHLVLCMRYKQPMTAARGQHGYVGVHLGLTSREVAWAWPPCHCLLCCCFLGPMPPGSGRVLGPGLLGV